MHNWLCCCSAVRCCALWYWQVSRKFFYTTSNLFGHIRNWRIIELANRTFSNIWRILRREIWYIYKQVLYKSEYLPFSDMKEDTDHLLPNYTASHRILPAGFAHTAVELAWIHKDKDQCMLRLHSQNPRHWKWRTSERVSQIFRQSYLSHFISGYFPSWRILDSVISTPLQKTLIYSHTILCTILDYSLS